MYNEKEIQSICYGWGKYSGTLLYYTVWKRRFYFGDIGEFSTKHTRQVSGQTHAKSKDDSYIWQPHKRQKLTEFKGIEQLLSYSLSVKHLNLSYENVYNGGKFQGSAFIDIRNYDKLINIMPFLLEPDKTQVFANLAKIYPKNFQIIIFTQTRPWVALTVHEP